MPHSYTKEQLNTLYSQLPEELKEALYSMETAEAIASVCDSYGIDDERVSQVARYVGEVLMGIILPSEFAGVLEQQIAMPKVLAPAIAKDINRLIFYPVKPALEQLHNTELGPKNNASEELPEIKAPPAEAAPGEPKPPSPDTYREPVE